MTTTRTLRSAAQERVLVSGVEALARLLVLRRTIDLEQGRDSGTFVSGYPGSPLGGFDFAVDALRGALRENGIVHEPGLNEELAAAAIWGTQMGLTVPYREVDGVVGVWYGKSPGVDRCGDVLRHANYMGTGPNGAVVMFVGDDPTAKSSTLPCDSQQALADVSIPVLVPGNQREILSLGLAAFQLSRPAGCWTALKVVTGVADGISSVDLGLDGFRVADPGIQAPAGDASPPRHAARCLRLVPAPPRGKADRPRVPRHDARRSIRAHYRLRRRGIARSTPNGYQGIR